MLDILDILLSMDMAFHSLWLHLLPLLRKKLQLLKQSVRSVKLNLKLILKLTPGTLPMDMDIHMPILDTTTHTLMDTMLSLPNLLRRLRLLLSLRGRDVILMLMLKLIPLFLHLTAEFSILLP